MTLLMREEEIIEETWEEARKEGIKKMVSVLKDLNISPQIILTKLQEEYGLSLETSKEYL